MNVGYLQKRQKKLELEKHFYHLVFFNVALLQFQHEQLFYSYRFYIDFLKSKQSLLSHVQFRFVFSTYRDSYVFLCNKCFLILHIFNKFSRLYFCPLCMFHIALTHFPLSHWHVQLNSCSQMSESCTKRLQSFQQSNKCSTLLKRNQTVLLMKSLT